MKRKSQGNLRLLLPLVGALWFLATACAPAVDNSAAGLPAECATCTVDESLSTVTAFTGTGVHQQVNLAWVNPSDPAFLAVTIRRDSAEYPGGPASGTAVYQGPSTTFNDSGLSNDTEYFYTAFASFSTSSFYSEPQTVAATPRAVVAAMAAGDSHSLALKSDGSLWGWGNNADSQLGLGDTTNRNVPTRLGLETDWTALAAGALHTLALKTDGSLWAWGFNFFGQLGLGATSPDSCDLMPCALNPTRVGIAADWTALAAKGSYSLALKSDGSVWGWGDNSNGQLGLGDNIERNVPTQVGPDTDWTAPAAGFSHTLALKDDGSLWAWGANASGQLGLGDNIDRSVPTPVGSATDWAALAAGWWHTLALKSDGTLWAWGDNIAGQLGLGDATARNSPTPVGTDSDWAALAAGDLHTLALKSDSSLWGWGNNSEGQLGLGDRTDRNVPTRVGTAADWPALAAGGRYSLAVKNDGSLWAWGRNVEGQLGLGDTTERNTPTLVDF